MVLAAGDWYLGRGLDCSWDCSWREQIALGRRGLIVFDLVDRFGAGVFVKALGQRLDFGRCGGVCDHHPHRLVVVDVRDRTSPVSCS